MDSKSVERIDILNAMGEIRNRLKELKRRTNVLRGDVLGEAEAQDMPETIAAVHLDGRISELYPILETIENNVGRLMSRIGCNEGQAVGQAKQQRAASGF